MITQEFRANRARFPRAELAAHTGEWVAFSADGTRIVASAVTLAGVYAQLDAIGVNDQDVAFECMGEKDNGSYLGAGELM